MNETIRTYIKARVRWRLAIGIGGWVVVATSVGTRLDNPLVSILGFLTFGGAILALQWIIFSSGGGRWARLIEQRAVPVRLNEPQEPLRD